MPPPPPQNNQDERQVLSLELPSNMFTVPSHKDS